MGEVISIKAEELSKFDEACFFGKQISDIARETKSKHMNTYKLTIPKSRYDALILDTQIDTLYTLISYRSSVYSGVELGYTNSLIERELQRYKKNLSKVLDDNFDKCEYAIHNFTKPLKKSLQFLDVA